MLFYAFEQKILETVSLGSRPKDLSPVFFFIRPQSQPDREIGSDRGFERRDEGPLDQAIKDFFAG